MEKMLPVAAALGFIFAVYAIVSIMSESPGVGPDLPPPHRVAVIPAALPPEDNKKKIVTLIRYGQKPGLYVGGEYYAPYDESLVDDLLLYYVIYDFWESPEAGFYGREFWEKKANHDIKDALVDAGAQSLEHYINATGYKPAVPLTAPNIEKELSVSKLITDQFSTIWKTEE